MARGLLKAAAVFFAVSTLGRLLGLARDLTIAHEFGASAETDAFLVAWMVPETVSTLLLDGAMLFALVPLFSREVERTGNAREAFRRTFLPVAAASCFAAAVVALCAPLIVGVLAPGLPLEGHALAARMVTVASATVFFMAMAGYLRALLNASGSFGTSAWVYAVYNVGIIGSVVLFGGAIGIESAAYGLALGSALMVLVQSPSALRKLSGPKKGASGRKGLPPLPTMKVDRALVGELALFVPVGAFLLARHAQVYVERFLGSFLDPGAISHLGYASRLGQFPMFAAITLAMVSFPALSRAVAAGRNREVGSIVESDARSAGLLLLPAVGFIGLFAPEIVSVLFERGSFGPQDAEATASVLRIYSVGLLAQAFVYIVSRPFFAATESASGERTDGLRAAGRPGVWTPLRAGLLGLAATAATDWALLGFGARGLALGNAVGIGVMALALIIDASRSGIASISFSGLVRFYAKTAAATAVAVLAALPLALPWGRPFLGEGPQGNLVTLLSAALVMCSVYLVAGRAFRLEELGEVVRTLASSLKGKGEPDGNLTQGDVRGHVVCEDADDACGGRENGSRGNETVGSAKVRGKDEGRAG